MGAPERKRVSIIVRGLVQGVGFRMFVLRQASVLNLSGWTRNRPDGTVEIEAEGDPELLDDLVRQAKKGPSRSQVRAVTVREVPPHGASGPFVIEE